MDKIVKRLKNYIPVRVELEDEAERRKRLQAQETYHPAKMASLVDGRVDYDDTPPKWVVALQAELAEIERMIECLDDPLERTVLRLRYIDGDEEDRTKPKKWTDVAAKLYGSPYKERMARRLHNKAVEHLNEKSHP